MTRRVRSYSNFVTGDSALALATEAVVATITGVRGEQPGPLVRLLGTAQVAGAAGSTFVQLRLRRDGLAGAQVGETEVTQSPGAVTVTATVAAEEQRVGETDATYVLTATANGAAGTLLTAQLLALVS